MRNNVSAVLMTSRVNENFTPAGQTFFFGFLFRFFFFFCRLNFGFTGNPAVYSENALGQEVEV